MSDADDERDSAVSTAAGCPTAPMDDVFTIFIVQPNEQISTLRNLHSGMSIFDMKGRLELASGVPAHLYYLVYPDGEAIPEDQSLHVNENVLDGYVLKMELYENWQMLYRALWRNDVEHVSHSGGVHMRDNHVIVPEEKDRYEETVRERGFVALYLASYMGHLRMVNMLLTFGVDVGLCTPFGRTCLHAAASADKIAVLDLLLKHGASARRLDYHGYAPIDFASQTKSTGCMKKLRLLRLNIRGVSGINKDRVISQRMRTRRHSGSREDVRHDSRHDEPSRYASVAEIGRAASHMSHYSTNSAHIRNLQVCAPAKSMSGSRNANTGETDVANRNSCTPVLTLQTPSRHGSTENITRSVRWGDTSVPSSASCWNVVEVNDVRPRSVAESVSVRPVELLRQKTMLTKYRDKQYEETNQPIAPATPTEPEPVAPHNADKGPAQQRLLRRRKKKKYCEWSTMKRRIKIATQSNNETKDDSRTPNDEAFKLWLEKKRLEAEEAAESDTSSDNINDSDDDDDRLEAFNRWVRKHNRPTSTNMHSAPANQIPNSVIIVGSTVQGDSRNPSADLHITAHRDWQKKRRFGTTPVQRRTLNDIKAERMLLEEKRKKLLMSAISFEEWMDHTEERKFLIKQILSADLQEIKKLEEDKSKDKTRLNSYDLWKQKLKERQEADTRRKGIIRRHEAGKHGDRMTGSRKTGVRFQDWAIAKQDNRRDGQSQTTTVVYQQRDQPGLDSSQEQWVLNKHRENIDASGSGSQLKPDNELIKILRQRRAASALS